MHISMAFLNKGDKVLVPNPGYPTYSSVSKLMGAEIISYDLAEENQWYPDFEELEKEDLSQVKIMWVNYPHMPTGAPATMKLFEQLVDFGRRHKILICNDNPYSLILNPKPMSLLSCPGAKDVVLELNSLSKSHNMAGWRVGMLAGRADYIQTVLRVKSNMDSGMFLPIQQAAIEALSNGYKWHEERNEAYRGRREQVWKILKLLGCTFQTSQTGMFIWAKIPNNSPSGEHFSEQILNECGVFITPGFIFGTAGEQYIRISLCTPASRLEEATTRISKFQLASV
ncbi:UNVERIFIED_CONTAM: hypothetical protein GTU68_046718 [Idotea baltica]|nr:hypothetical protein [Idotea baltica]